MIVRDGQFFQLAMQAEGIFLQRFLPLTHTYFPRIQKVRRDSAMVPGHIGQCGRADNKIFAPVESAHSGIGRLIENYHRTQLDDAGSHVLPISVGKGMRHVIDVVRDTAVDLVKMLGAGVRRSLQIA